MMLYHRKNSLSTPKKLQWRLKGFTLVEILLVIVIAGVLAGFTTYSIGGTAERSRDANRKKDAEAILHALASYASDHDWSFTDMVGTFPNCSGIAAPADTDGDLVFDRCQAFFYSTPSHPGGNGRNNWSVLQTYLQPYLGNLPVDPKNKFNSWNGPFPNYASNSLRGGYYIVVIVDQEVTQTSGCGGMILIMTHYFETAAENTKDPLTNGSRFPTMDNSNPTCQGFRTVITLPGQI